MRGNPVRMKNRTKARILKALAKMAEDKKEAVAGEDQSKSPHKSKTED